MLLFVFSHYFIAFLDKFLCQKIFYSFQNAQKKKISFLFPFTFSFNIHVTYLIVLNEFYSLSFNKLNFGFKKDSDRKKRKLFGSFFFRFYLFLHKFVHGFINHIFCLLCWSFWYYLFILICFVLYYFFFIKKIFFGWAVVGSFLVYY